MNRIRSILVLGGALCLPASVAVADTISPSSFSATLDVGESVTINKTVTVEAGKPTSSKVDVFFLADNTGSMGGIINQVKASAASILSSTAGLGDVQFGVGRYVGEAGTTSFSLITQLTDSQASAQAGINAWFASGGGDEPEANLYALHHVATDTAWRVGSERIVVWFGDAPGHDPSPGGTTPADGKKTEAQTIAALQTAGVNVQALNVGNSRLDLTGQAGRIVAATGGDLYNGVQVANVVDTITDAIEAVVSQYTTVSIDTSEVPAGVDVDVTPLSHVGSFDRSIERSFDFEVTFTGVTPGTHSFDLYATVDGGRVATEADRIIVNTGGGTSVPDSGSTLALAGMALLGLGALRRK